MTRGVLYLTYTGLLEPLGQSQVLAYQERLATDGPIHIVSFERPEDLQDHSKVEALRNRVEASGIQWHPQRYHKRPSALATLWDIAVGTWAGLCLVRRNGLGIVHARSYVASVMALVIKRWTGARFLFDMRGFWADERVDGGLWPRAGRMYRMAKWFERQFLLQADHVVSLTHAGATEIRRFDYLQGRLPPITVIPTCADLERFKPSDAPRDGPFTLGYVGSAGTWYLFDAAVAAFNALRQRVPAARFLIINRDAHPYIRDRLRVGGVPESCVELRQATHAEMAEQIQRMQAGVFFIKPVFSKQASAPTKLAEFLGCGVPCLSNTGVGDMAKVLNDDRVGVAVDAMDPSSIDAGIEALLQLVEEPDITSRCVASAARHFSLVEGVARYRAVYGALRDA
jgi:glycosyltransferase involved in cell wall biosynthesis